MTPVARLSVFCVNDVPVELSHQRDPACHDPEPLHTLSRSHRVSVRWHTHIFALPKQ